MSTSTTQPTFLAVEERDGHPTLGGRRQFLDTFDAQVAEELRLFALEPVEIVDIAPVAASTHVRLINVPGLDPAPRRVAAFTCPCGATADLWEGATPEEWEQWHSIVDEHDGCRAAVA